MYKFVRVWTSNDYQRMVEGIIEKNSNDYLVSVPASNRKGLICPILYKICHSHRKIFSLLRFVRPVWLPLLLDKRVKSTLSKIASEKVCFFFNAYDLVQNGKAPFNYLRKKYPGCKFICFFTDIVELHYKYYKFFELQDVRDTFDYILTYNELDAKQYNMILYPPVLIDYRKLFPENKTTNDILFVGENKNRFSDLIHIYETCTKYGFKCDFTILYVDEKDQIYGDVINYSKRLPYKEVLEKTCSSKCIVNLSQKNSSGITLRDYEAISLNKFIITNNEKLKTFPFYTEEKVIWIDDLESQLYKIAEFQNTKWKKTGLFYPNEWFQWIESSVLER